MNRFIMFSLKRRPIYFAITSLILLSLVLVVISFDYWDKKELAVIPDQPTVPPQGNVTIIIKVPARLLEVYSDGKLHKKYRIAVGKNDTPTPLGDWTVIWKSYRSGDIFGTRFLALDVPWGGYGIHGTNQPWSIGHFISHGCIRLRNEDVEELYEWIPVGTPVTIQGDPSVICRTLKYEDYGSDVVQLQQKLKKLGYLEGRADGFFNKDTEISLKRFQHDHSIKPSGVVDDKTCELLGL